MAKPKRKPRRAPIERVFPGVAAELKKALTALKRVTRPSKRG